MYVTLMLVFTALSLVSHCGYTDLTLLFNRVLQLT